MEPGRFEDSSGCIANTRKRQHQPGEQLERLWNTDFKEYEVETTRVRQSASLEDKRTLNGIR